MYDVKVSAPGKLFLSGEYAVLEGAEAVIDSVDRRVFATTTRKNIPQSLLIKDIKKTTTAFLTERSGSSVGQIPNIDIDSKGFSISKRKLGIGSSAAVAASATAALFEWAGLPIKNHLTEILMVATNGHRAYQGGEGSGADVATSVYGGTIIFTAGTSVEQTAFLPIKKVFIWTGKSASTVSLVGAVKKLQEQNPRAYHQSMEPLVALAEQLAQCYRTGHVNQLITLTHQYGDAMEALGQAAQVEIVTDKMKTIAQLAQACGGACKPSGAGGGDAAMAVFKNDSDAESFKIQLNLQELEILNFTTHTAGVRKE